MKILKHKYFRNRVFNTETKKLGVEIQKNTSEESDYDIDVWVVEKGDFICANAL